jgi:CHAD domain-containing protein
MHLSTVRQASMEPIPLPSHIHYELLLQLLERQTMFAVDKSDMQEQIHQLIISLRKALAQQKRFEEACERHKLSIDYRWSLNKLDAPEGQAQDLKIS